MFTHRLMSWLPPRPGPATLPVAFLVASLAVLVACPSATEAQTLRGGTASLDRQNQQATAHDFSYLATPADVRRFVDLGYLEPVVPNRDFDVHNVSFPYARAEVRLFIERLASQYRAACGEKLVVTSLTRPQSSQPWNASSRSVHPTGMAVDLRRSQKASCRSWLERTLLSLEREGLLEAIYERNPPHYHVAVYPRPYAQYVARITGREVTVVTASDESAARQMEITYQTHRVARGETLSRIADRYGVAVARIRADNGVRGDRILVGQQLRIPVYREVTRVAEAPASEAAQSVAAPASTSGAAAANLQTPVSHQVRSGESLWSIARAYGTTESEIRAMNGLASNRILAGQRLEIPDASAELPSTLRHTVRRGESLWAIARRHGTTVDTLARTNGIRGSAIQPGQVLEVPVSP
jgi:LysM repeat protein